MPSRSPRGSKPDVATSKSAPQSQAQQQPGADEAPASSAQVVDTSLQRREIPSFSDSREARIAEAAYWRAERRGFEPGRELEDWLEAEREIDQQSQSREENNSERSQ